MYGCCNAGSDDLRKSAHSGPGFPKCKIGGVLVIKSLGDQDEAVDITGDGDTDATPAGTSPLLPPLMRFDCCIDLFMPWFWD